MTPAPPGSQAGNRITANRWKNLLEGLGHEVTVLVEYQGEPCEMLLALHAVRSAASVERFARLRPGRPIVVTITGTDIYSDGPTLAIARRTAAMASRVLFLREPSPADLQRLFAGADAGRWSVIYQSAEPPTIWREPRTDRFEVCALGHLRPVKDPFRAAQAARLLPESSRVHIVQVGAALSPEMADQARAEEASNPRYSWRGELPRQEALTFLSGCRLLAMTSISEGGPSAVSEALACRVPVISSRVEGVVGLLGTDYPGYFPVGGTKELAALLQRCEQDAGFYATLVNWCEARRPRIDPAREAASWQQLLAELE